jgi:protein involved in polysaccharide export with SLBB domain
MKLLLRGLFACLWVFTGVLLAGCGSSSNNLFLLDHPRPPGATGAPSGPGAQALADVARFRVGETVTVTFSGVPTPIDPHQETIKENGTITLPLIGPIYAVGKTSGELQYEIYTNYVPKYYVRLTVTVKSGDDRVVYVAGEVRNPGRVIYMNDMTVTKAIQAASGLTDFANHRKVWLTHASNGQRTQVNYDKALRDPAKDPPVFPEDQINVDRSW